MGKSKRPTHKPDLSDPVSLLYLPDPPLHDFPAWNDFKEAQMKILSLSRDSPYWAETTSTFIYTHCPTAPYIGAERELELETLYNANESTKKSTAVEQYRLTVEFQKHSAFFDLERNWISTGREIQEKLLMDALKLTVDALGPDAVCLRALAPEVTISGLLENNGRSWLDLFAIATPENLYTLSDDNEVFLIPHSVIDAAIRQRGRAGNSTSELFLVQRTSFIIYFLLNSLYHFVGKPERAMKAQPWIAPRPKDFKKMEPILPPGDPFLEAFTENAKNRVRYFGRLPVDDHQCKACRKSGSSLPEGKKLQHCAACERINRRVFYCSRECQLKDWKTHKSRCGKYFKQEPAWLSPQHQTPSIADAKNPVVSLNNRTDIPAPDPGFRRSPALAIQVKMLCCDSESPDYILLMSEDFHPVSFVNNSFQKLTFIAFRNRAFANGDHRAVVGLFYLLATFLPEFKGLSKEGILEVFGQMRREYGEGVDEKIREFSKVTPESPSIKDKMLKLGWDLGFDDFEAKLAINILNDPVNIPDENARRNLINDYLKVVVSESTAGGLLNEEKKEGNSESLQDREEREANGLFKGGLRRGFFS